LSKDGTAGESRQVGREGEGNKGEDSSQEEEEEEESTRPG